MTPSATRYAEPVGDREGHCDVAVLNCVPADTGFERLGQHAQNLPVHVTHDGRKEEERTYRPAKVRSFGSEEGWHGSSGHGNHCPQDFRYYVLGASDCTPTGQVSNPLLVFSHSKRLQQPRKGLACLLRKVGLRQKQPVVTGGRLVKHGAANLGGTAACEITEPPGRKMNSSTRRQGRERRWRSRFEARQCRVPSGRDPLRALGASWMEPETDRPKTRQCVVYSGRQKCQEGNSG